MIIHILSSFYRIFLGRFSDIEIVKILNEFNN